MSAPPSLAAGADAAAARGRIRDRALTRSLVSGFAVRALAGGVGILTVGVAARALGEVRYGVLATLTASAGVLTFADLGIGNGLMTRLAAAHGRKDLADARAVVSAGLTALLLLGLVVAIAGLLLAAVLPWNRILGVPGQPSGQLRMAAGLFFVCLGLAVPAGIGQRVQLGLQRGTAANAWLLGGAAGTLPAVALCAAARLPLWCFVLATVGSSALVSVVQSVWVLTWGHPQLRPSRGLVTRRAAVSLSQLSGLFLVLNVAVAVAYQTDAVIVAATLGAATAATFAIGLRLFGPLGTMLSGASEQLWTAVADALACGDLAWARARVGRVIAGSLAASVLAALVLVLIGRPVARIWVGPGLVPSLGLLIAFAAWTVYSVVMTQLSYVLNAAEVIRPQVVMAVCMALSNLVLSIWLTRRLGPTGPLLGSLLAHLLCSGVPAIWLSVRILHGPAALGDS